MLTLFQTLGCCAIITAIIVVAMSIEAALTEREERER